MRIVSMGGLFIQGDDYEWVSVPERLLRLGLLSFVLISVSTYTANLAGFLLAPNFVIYGPSVTPPQPYALNRLNSTN